MFKLRAQFAKPVQTLTDIPLQLPGLLREFPDILLIGIPLLLADFLIPNHLLTFKILRIFRLPDFDRFLLLPDLTLLLFHQKAQLLLIQKILIEQDIEADPVKPDDPALPSSFFALQHLPWHDRNRK